MIIVISTMTYQDRLNLNNLKIRPDIGNRLTTCFSLVNLSSLIDRLNIDDKLIISSFIVD